MQICQLVVQHFVHNAFVEKDGQYPIMHDICGGLDGCVVVDATQIECSAATDESNGDRQVIGQDLNEGQDFNVVFS